MEKEKILNKTEWKVCRLKLTLLYIYPMDQRIPLEQDYLKIEFEIGRY